MVSFHMWRKSLDAHPDPRQVTWIFGDERVLVDDVVGYIRRTLQPEAWNYLGLRAGDSSEREIWAAAEQHPLDNEKRLIVIHDAEKLKDTDRFVDWLKARTWNPKTYLVLISNEERIPKTTITQDQRKQGVKPETVPHLKAIGARGHVIECRPFTQATAKHSVAWVQSKVRMPENIARHLMERSNFDLRLSRDLLLKLRALGTPPTIATINELLTQQPRDTFIDALFRVDRKEALLAAREVDPAEYGLLIGQIDAQLDLVGMIHDLQGLYQSPGEITKAAGRQAFLVPMLTPVAKHYDEKRRHSIRRLLGVIDQAHRGGISDGLLEVLTANW